MNIHATPQRTKAETARAVAEYLSAQGAQHIARGEVWDDRGDPGDRSRGDGRTIGASCAIVIVGMTLWASVAGAQGVGFLTEQERLASYCAGVSEARMRDMGEFLKNQCAGSTPFEKNTMPMRSGGPAFAAP